MKPCRKTENIETNTNTLHIMSTRNGKIARLPRSVRNELNERLERSEPSPQLLDWLNALPEVQKVVKDDFAGVPISKQNLSEWRQGGFEEWLARQDLCEDARDLRQLSEEMDDDESQMVLADDVAQVLAARFGTLIANWNGEVDEKFEAKSRVLNRLCRSVVQLQRGMHRSRREGFELTCKLEEQEKSEQAQMKKKLLRPFFDTLRLNSMAKLFGGGTAGRKIAQYILAVQNDNLDAEFDVLPTDKFEHEEPAPQEAEPVKPTQKRQNVKQAGKSRPDNAAKPLEESEMEGENDGKSSQAGSNPVKVNQTDLAPISPIPPMLPISPIRLPGSGFTDPPKPVS